MSDKTDQTYLPRIDTDDALLIFKLAAKVGFNITVETEHRDGQYGLTNRVRHHPGRNTEIILYAGNRETGLDNPQAQARLVLDVLSKHVDRDYHDQVATRTYRDGTPITWTTAMTPNLAAAQEFFRDEGIQISAAALKGAADFFTGLHLLARDQDKELDLHDAVLIAKPVVTWRALALRNTEVLTFTATEVVRHRTEFSYAELDRRLPGWEHYLKGRIDAADAPAWREALINLVDGRICEDSQRHRHLGVDEVQVRDYEREDNEPFWIPFYG